MASRTKKYDTQKLLGQVYTPRFIVEKILHDIGWDTAQLLGKTVLDPSCGDGRFLVVVAELIIKYSPENQLKENLEKIHGWDIDPQAVQTCKANLEALVSDKNLQINWNIQLANALRMINKADKPTFDCIVGNPPYIRIQHLEASEREFIKQAYTFCQSGSTDAYIAFYELCNHLLNSDGICALITPNTFLYSQTAKALRAYFSTHCNLAKLTNYGDIQLFDNATTYSAITIFNKKINTHFIFEQADSKTTFKAKSVDFKEIQHQKIWQLSVNEVINNTGVKLKDICKIHVGITTLCDKAYIFKVHESGEQEPNYIWVETKLKGIIKLEKGIIKPIIKASKLKSSNDPITECVLFPYTKNEHKTIIIQEADLQANYPLAYQYLQSVREELDKRDNGKPNSVAWYAFGRSQGLETSFGKKILFSPISNKPNFIWVDNEDCTFYSGYCIKYSGDYNFLLRQLNSERLEQFIAVSSRDFRGGWKAYNKRVLEEFTIEL